MGFIHSNKNPPGIFHYSEIPTQLRWYERPDHGVFPPNRPKATKTRLTRWNILRPGSHKVNLSSIHWFYLAHFHSFHLILTHKSFIEKDESDNLIERIWLKGVYGVSGVALTPVRLSISNPLSLSIHAPPEYRQI